MGRFNLSLAAAAFAAILTTFGINQASAGGFSQKGYYGYGGFQGYAPGYIHRKRGVHRQHRHRRHVYRNPRVRKFGHRRYRAHTYHRRHRHDGYSFVFRFGY